MTKECGISGCGRPFRCKGMCDSHYRKAIRARRRPRLTKDQMYEAKVNRSGGPAACHLWTASSNSGGYGLFAHDGETLAARWAYKQYVGPLAPSEVVRHTCDNPACHNRSHWIKGTQRQNILDAVERGRQHRPRGSKNVKAKLTEELVIKLKAEFAEGRYLSQSAASRAYGISPATVSSILRGVTWKHVQG